ncbi:MAG: response regulator [Chloroflexi bacterium]|mgnify:CR=1 FL=1|nr:response regulator [Chloroflexota bacterium]
MSEPPDKSAPEIVVIDDDHELLKLISLLVRRIGATAQTFADGETALTYLQTNVPDLVILDLMLPDIEGLDLLHKLRQQTQFDSMPVLILSARTDPNVVRQGLGLGADSYVTKPYIANSLIDRIQLLLSVGRQVISH